MTYQEYLELKAKRAGKLKEGEALLAKKDFDGHKALKPSWPRRAALPRTTRA